MTFINKSVFIKSSRISLWCQSSEYVKGSSEYCLIHRYWFWVSFFTKIYFQSLINLSDARKVKLNRRLVDIEISLQRSHQASKSAKELKAIDAIKKNPKYFYSNTKSFSSLKSRIGPLLDANNKYTSSSLEMAKILPKQYKSVFS